MEKPLVTLLLPCYNCEKTLDRFMRSVISESYRPLELICIDDGSTDDTAKLLKNFETILKESGVQYTVLTQENIGDRKSTRLNSSHRSLSRMPSSA